MSLFRKPPTRIETHDMDWLDFDAALHLQNLPRADQVCFSATRAWTKTEFLDTLKRAHVLKFLATFGPNAQGCIFGYLLGGGMSTSSSSSSGTTVTVRKRRRVSSIAS